MNPVQGAGVNAVESATPVEMAFAHYLVQAGWLRSIPESRSECIVAEAAKTLGIDERKCEEMLWLDRVQRYMDKCRKRLAEEECQRVPDAGATLAPNPPGANTKPEVLDVIIQRGTVPALKEQ